MTSAASSDGSSAKQSRVSRRQNRRRSRVLVELGRRRKLIAASVRHSGLEDALFPLTQTPSLREREEQGTPSVPSDCARFADRLARYLPLPKGEGRGEGEGDAWTTDCARIG